MGEKAFSFLNRLISSRRFRVLEVSKKYFQNNKMMRRVDFRCDMNVKLIHERHKLGLKEIRRKSLGHPADIGVKRPINVKMKALLSKD